MNIAQEAFPNDQNPSTQPSESHREQEATLPAGDQSPQTEPPRYNLAGVYGTSQPVAQAEPAAPAQRAWEAPQSPAAWQSWSPRGEAQAPSAASVQPADGVPATPEHRSNEAAPSDEIEPEFAGFRAHAPLYDEPAEAAYGGDSGYTPQSGVEEQATVEEETSYIEQADSADQPDIAQPELPSQYDEGQDFEREGPSQMSDSNPEPALGEPEPSPIGNRPLATISLDVALLQLCQQVGLGLVRVDAEARCWPLNEAGSKLLEAIGGSAGETAPAPVLQAVATGSSTTEAMDSVVSAESKHISASSMNLADGSVVALRDHTEERLLQERLLQSEKMASVGQLVSGVAHELNNPLTGVMGFAQLLLARELEETVRSQIQTIYGEAERAAKIVQNLLSFARRRKPTKEMADINSLLQRVLELRSYDFTIRNISLDMTMDARMQRVWVDPDQVQQVFFNLIKNAEQAMIDSHGGGRLTVVTRGLPEGVRISIADDGPGIPLDVQRRIFDPFFTTKEAGQGTGLGLTICYSIIDDHGGRIWTENLPAGGAVFHIDLPLSVGEEREPEGSRGSAAADIRLPPAISGRRILVVDDEESIRLLLHDILRLDRHDVKVARSGLEAAELTRHERFDVIITDMKMPGLDGASFYRQVRERDPEQARRIIFITGDTVSPDTRFFLQRVSNPVLSKPFKIGPLRDAIETVLAAG